MDGLQECCPLLNRYHAHVLSARLVQHAVDRWKGNRHVSSGSDWYCPLSPRASDYLDVSSNFRSMFRIVSSFSISTILQIFMIIYNLKNLFFFTLLLAVENAYAYARVYQVCFF